MRGKKEDRGSKSQVEEGGWERELATPIPCTREVEKEERTQALANVGSNYTTKIATTAAAKAGKNPRRRI